MIDRVVGLARQAGLLIEEVRRQGFEVRDKGDQGPVTRADRGADELLKRGLLDLLPCGWLSEESRDDPARLEQRRVWVVDPLDGTLEFVAGRPEYGVSVALVVSGRPQLAVVHNPARDDTFWCERGAGVRRNGEPAAVREGDRLLASRTELERGEFEPFEDWQIEPMGSIAYKLARVAAGEGSVTLSRGPKCEWDVCAGALLVEEAGGRVADVFGAELRFNAPEPVVRGIVAGAPAAFERALRRIGEIGPSDRLR